MVLKDGPSSSSSSFCFFFFFFFLSFFLSFFLPSSCRLSLVSKCLSALAACNLFSDALPRAVGWGQRTYAYYIPPTYTIHLRYIHRFTYHIHSPWDQINSMWACQKKTSKTYGKILKFPCSIYFRIIFGNYRAIILKCTNSSIYIYLHPMIFLWCIRNIPSLTFDLPVHLVHISAPGWHSHRAVSRGGRQMDQAPAGQRVQWHPVPAPSLHMHIC